MDATQEADKKTDDPREHLASDPCVFCKETSKKLEKFITGYTTVFAVLIIGYCGYVTWMVSSL